MMMRWVITSVLLTAAPYWISTALAGSGDQQVEEAKTEAQVFVVANAAGGNHKCVVGDDDQEHAVRVITVVGEEDDETTATATGHGKVLKWVTEPQAEDRGWLGVSVGPVPEAVAAQTGFQGQGVLILNVVKDSPAYQGGLKVHDIVLSLGAQESDGDAGHLAKLVGAHQPGEEVDIVVLRKGVEKPLRVKLGARADLDKMEWVMDVPALTEFEEQVKTRGKFVQRGPKGEWIMKDLGDLEELADLPDNIRMLIPKSGKRSFQISMDDDHKIVKTRVEHDGGVLVVEQEDDGEITVHRVDQDGKETTAVYADEEELREGDEEAYEAFKSADETKVLKINLDGGDLLKDLDFEVELGDWHEQLGEWQGHLDEALREANEAYELAMEQFEEAMEQLRSGKTSAPGAFPGWPMFLHEKHDDLGKVFGPGFLHPGKPRHTFELGVDGKIEVRIRKGDSELVRLFENEADLAAREPDLHARYQELMAAEDY